MLALQIKDIKTFMNKLLSSDTFNRFFLKEAQIQTGNTFFINGHLNKSFFSREELEDWEQLFYDLVPWKDMQGICFQLIKGKKLPLLFKLTLVYHPQDSQTLLKEADASEYSSLLKSFVLTVKYDQKGLLLTTGTSFSTFIMDKTVDSLWDEALRRFLIQNGIDFDEP